MKTLVKDFKCEKYTNRIELSIDKGNRFIFSPSLHTLDELVKKYPNYYVYSYKFYEDTKSLSLVIGKSADWECEEDKNPHLSKDQLESLMKSLGMKVK